LHISQNESERHSYYYSRREAYDSDRTIRCPIQSFWWIDDEAVRALMNATLERKGFDVAGAASVTEALRRIATENFDVLITDLHMPNPSDGFTVGPSETSEAPVNGQY
jgi:hypothetical protein